MPGLSLPKSKFISLFCEALLHGGYTVLTGAALYFLLRKRREQRLQRSNLLMIASTLLMYCMSTTQVALVLHVDLIAFFDQHAIEGGVTIFEDQKSRFTLIPIMLQCFNSLIGDAIVAWRTWVLCGRDRRVLVFPMICVVGSLITGIGIVVALSNSPSGQDIRSHGAVVWLMSFGTLSGVMNVYAVLMMSWKAWMHTRFMKKMKCPIVMGHSSTAMLLIIESGFFYCFFEIIDSVLLIVNSNSFYITANMLSVLTGIYPTATIVLVCLKFAYADQLSRAETLARQTVKAPHQNGGKRESNARFPTNPGATSTLGGMRTMSAEGPETSSRGEDIKSNGLNAVGPGVEPCAIEWPQLGQNGAKGDIRLQSCPTFSGMEFDSVLLAGKECLPEGLESEHNTLGPEDGIAHAV